MKNKNYPKQPKNLLKMVSRGSLSMSQPPGKRKGFSLIELLLIIGFSTGATALAFVAYKSWTDNNNADLASQTLSQISKGAQSISSVSLDYAALENSPAGLLPTTVFDRVTNKPVNSPWGAISITLSNGAKPRDSYTVLFADATPNGCTRTILKNYQDYSQVSVNRAMVWTMGDAALDPAVAGKACAVSKNEVAFQSMTLIGSMPTSTPTPTLIIAAAPPLPSPVALASIPAASPASASPVSPTSTSPTSPSSGSPGPGPGPGPGPAPAPTSVTTSASASSGSTPPASTRPAQGPGMAAQVAALSTIPWLSSFLQNVGILQAPVQLAVLPVVIAPSPPPAYVPPAYVPSVYVAPTQVAAAPAAPAAPVSTVTAQTFSCGAMGFPSDYTGSVTYQVTSTPGSADVYGPPSSSCVPPAAVAAPAPAAAAAPAPATTTAAPAVVVLSAPPAPTAPAPTAPTAPAPTAPAPAVASPPSPLVSVSTDSCNSIDINVKLDALYRFNHGSGATNVSLAQRYGGDPAPFLSFSIPGYFSTNPYPDIFDPTYAYHAANDLTPVGNAVVSTTNTNPQTIIRDISACGFYTYQGPGE